MNNNIFDGGVNGIRKSRILSNYPAFEKSKGEKGGKVIGQTESGKDIYEHKNAYDYDGELSVQDHKDAARHHMKQYDSTKDTEKHVKHLMIAKTHAKKGGFLDEGTITFKKSQADCEDTIEKAKTEGKPLTITNHDLKKNSDLNKYHQEFATHFDNAMNIVHQNPINKSSKEFLTHVNNAAGSYATLRKGGLKHNDIVSTYTEAKGDKMNEYWKKHSSDMLTIIGSKHDKWQEETEAKAEKEKGKKKLIQKSNDDDEMSEEEIEKAKHFAIGAVDKAGKHVKTAEGWKPISTHGHLVNRDLKENSRHGNMHHNLTLDNFNGDPYNADEVTIKFRSDSDRRKYAEEQIKKTGKSGKMLQPAELKKLAVLVKMDTESLKEAIQTSIKAHKGDKKKINNIDEAIEEANKK